MEPEARGAEGVAFADVLERGVLRAGGMTNEEGDRNADPLQTIEVEVAGTGAEVGVGVLSRRLWTLCC